MEKLKEIYDNNESIVRNAQAREIIDILKDKKIPFIKLEEGSVPQIVLDMENKAGLSLSVEDMDTQEKLAEFLSLIKAKVTRDESGNPQISLMANGQEVNLNF